MFLTCITVKLGCVAKFKLEANILPRPIKAIKVSDQAARVLDDLELKAASRIRGLTPYPDPGRE